MPDEFVFNKDLTEANLEALEESAKILDALKRCASGEVSLDDCMGRRVGTVVNETVLKKAYAANNLLDIIQTVGDIETEKFAEPDPEATEAFVAFTTQDCYMNYSLTAKNALGELIRLCDELIVRTIDDTHNRYVFLFKNLWKEYREKNENEMLEEWDAWEEYRNFRDAEDMTDEQDE